MGFFDLVKSRFLGKPKRAASPDLSANTVSVPPGHSLEFFYPLGDPGVRRTSGQVILADLGLGGDERIERVEAIFDQVEEEIDRSDKMTLLPDGEEGKTLTDLFAPASPKVQIVTMVIWCLSGDSLAYWLVDEGRCRKLVERLHALHFRAGRPFVSYAFFYEDVSPQAKLTQEILASIGIHSQRFTKERVVLAEITRPERIILSPVVGSPLPLQAPYSPPEARTATEWEALFHRCAEVFSGDRPLIFAPHLRRLILAAMDGKSSELDAELRSRTWTLFVLANPQENTFLIRTWNGHHGITAFPDIQYLEQAAREMNLPRPPLCGLTYRQLVQSAAKLDCGLALNAYRDPNTPLYFFCGSEEIRRLNSELG